MKDREILHFSKKKNNLILPRNISMLSARYLFQYLIHCENNRTESKIIKFMCLRCVKRRTVKRSMNTMYKDNNGKLETLVCVYVCVYVCAGTLREREREREREKERERQVSFKILPLGTEPMNANMHQDTQNDNRHPSVQQIIDRFFWLEWGKWPICSRLE